MDIRSALAMFALGSAIATDVVGTFVIEQAAQRRDRRQWVTAAGIFLASLALFALRRGERFSTRKATALALLVLGVVVLQLGASHG